MNSIKIKSKVRQNKPIKSEIQKTLGFLNGDLISIWIFLFARWYIYLLLSFNVNIQLPISTNSTSSPFYFEKWLILEFIASHSIKEIIYIHKNEGYILLLELDRICIL